MAIVTLKIFVDVDGRQLVTSDSSADAVALPAIRQGDTINLEIMLLRRTAYWPFGAGSSLPYSRIDPTGLSMRVGIGTPNPDDSAPPPPIYQSLFTADAAKSVFRGVLYVSPSASETLLGGALSKSLTLEIEVGESGDRVSVYQGPITLLAWVLSSETPTEPPPVSDRYITLAEAMSLFFPRAGDYQLILRNAAETRIVRLYVDSEGNLQTGHEEV